MKIEEMMKSYIVDSRHLKPQETRQISSSYKKWEVSKLWRHEDQIGNLSFIQFVHAPCLL